MLRYLTLIAHFKKKNIKGASISLIKIKSQGYSCILFSYIFIIDIQQLYVLTLEIQSFIYCIFSLLQNKYKK